MVDVPKSRPTPPASRIIRLADFDEVAALFGQWQGQLQQLSTGHFEGTLRIVQGGLVRIVGVEANQRVLLRGREAAGVVTIHPVTAGNTLCLWQGRRLPPGRIVISGVDAEIDHCSGRRTSDIGVSICPRTLAEAARSLLPTNPFSVTRTWAALAPPPDTFAVLQRQLERLLTLGVASPLLLRTPDGHRLEQECVRALVAALNPVSEEAGLSRSSRSRLLRRAEEFMRARMDQPVGAIDLCRELCVSDRTLRLTFRERYGLGPMTYFKLLRLNAVRSHLKAAPGATIADVARLFGFHHLGNFAAAYRRLFGERPSQTERGAST